MSRRSTLRLMLTPLVALGLVALVVPQAFAQPPANDDFDNATVIQALPFTTTEDTSEATAAVDDPEPSCVGTSHTVWFAFTPTADVTLTANTFESDYDTTLSVWTGTRGSLAEVACNDDFESLQSKVRFDAPAGVTHFFMIGSFFDSPGGTLVFSVNELVAAPNDDFDEATVIASLPFTDNVSTTQATTAADDPDCFGRAHTVWYSFTPTEGVSIEADTFGSDYDTTLSAYTGSRGALTQVACNNDFSFGQASRVRFNASAGVTVSIMVGSFDETDGGELFLTVRTLPPPVVLGVTIDPTGSVDRNGVASIRGTVSCSREALGISMFGTLRQQIGKRVTTGSFGASIDCSGEVPWTATVVGETGKYRRGDAQATVGLTHFDEEREEEVRARASRTVRLQ
jgi:hypothetical protein